MSSESESNSTSDQLNRITVFYDGACPTCVRDRAVYERFCGGKSTEVEWCDITGKDDALSEIGIDPGLAMRELHVRTGKGQIVSEMDAYILLLERSIWLKPLAWLLSLPLIRPTVARIYHWSVGRRLSRTGRV